MKLPRPTYQSAGDVVFGIGHSGNGLIEAAHEPGDVEQSRPIFGDFQFHRRQLRLGKLFAGNEASDQACAAEQFHPVSGNLVIIPPQCAGLIDREHKVKMIGHDGISANVDGEYLGQFEDPGSDPAAPMSEIPPGPGINPAQELAPNASRDDVIVRSSVQRNQLATGHGHSGRIEFWIENQPSGYPTAEL